MNARVGGTDSTPIDALERATLSAMSLVHVQILVIDEVHQLLAGSAREQRLSLNLIKSISNDLRICIVAAGTGDARHAIEADPQIRRRFDPFALPRLTENGAFRDFVCAFGKLYPLRKVSNLGERGLLQRLLHTSEGITGPVTRLLSLAKRFAPAPSISMRPPAWSKTPHDSAAGSPAPRATALPR
jgi:hypothetical protein